MIVGLWQESSSIRRPAESTTAARRVQETDTERAESRAINANSLRWLTTISFALGKLCREAQWIQLISNQHQTHSRRKRRTTIIGKGKREGEDKTWKREMEIYRPTLPPPDRRTHNSLCPTDPSSPLRWLFCIIIPKVPPRVNDAQTKPILSCNNF